MSAAIYLLLLQRGAKLPSDDQLEDPQVYVFDLPNKVKVFDYSYEKLAVASNKPNVTVMETGKPVVSIYPVETNTVLVQSSNNKVVII